MVETWAALAAWSLVASPLGVGPAHYLDSRGVLSDEARSAYAYPADAALYGSPAHWYWQAWTAYWRRLGSEHRRADPD